MSDNRPQPPIVVQSPGVVAVASDTISALKASPMLLVMVLLNCAFIAAAAWYLRNQQDNAFKLVSTMLDRCLSAPMRPYTAPPSEHQGGVYPPSPLESRS